jgi:F-type H+-transporting ATPase subunit b
MNRFAPVKLPVALLVLALVISVPYALGENRSPDHAGASGQDEHAAGTAAQHEVKTPFEGSLINSVTTLVIFVVLLVILGKFAWKPLLAVLQKREEFILNSLEQAKRDREEAEARLREMTERLNNAREEAGKIVEEGRRDAETVRRSMESHARAEADALIERAKREIEIAGDTAVREIYEAAGDLATEIASRVIRKEVSETEHLRLVRESIDEVRKFHEGDNKLGLSESRRQ